MLEVEGALLAPERWFREGPAAPQKSSILGPCSRAQKKQVLGGLLRPCKAPGGLFVGSGGLARPQKPVFGASWGGLFGAPGAHAGLLDMLFALRDGLGWFGDGLGMVWDGFGDGLGMV